MGIHQWADMFLIEPRSYRWSIFEVRSKYEEEINKLEDRSPAQSDLHSISNLDENKQRALIEPT